MDDVRARCGVQLGEELGQVKLHRALAHAESVSYGSIREPFVNQPKHFQLAWGKSAVRRGARCLVAH